MGVSSNVLLFDRYGVGQSEQGIGRRLAVGVRFIAFGALFVGHQRESLVAGILVVGEFGHGVRLELLQCLVYLLAFGSVGCVTDVRISGKFQVRD